MKLSLVEMFPKYMYFSNTKTHNMIETILRLHPHFCFNGLTNCTIYMYLFKKKKVTFLNGPEFGSVIEVSLKSSMTLPKR